MSRDGKPEIIAVETTSDEILQPVIVDCGGHLMANHGGRFRRCIQGHVHCTHCHRQARRFRNNWTCGKCPGKPV